MNDFSLFVPTRVRFGPGWRQEVPDLLAAQGWTRVGLVMDHHLRDVLRSSRGSRICSAAWHTSPSAGARSRSRPTARSRRCAASLPARICTRCSPSAAAARSTWARPWRRCSQHRPGDLVLRLRQAHPTRAAHLDGTHHGWDGGEVTPNASFVDTRERCRRSARWPSGCALRSG